MLTSTYFDLLADAKLYKTSNSLETIGLLLVRAYITKRANVGVAFSIAALAKVVSTAWFLVKKPTRLGGHGSRTWVVK